MDDRTSFVHEVSRAACPSQLGRLQSRLLQSMSPRSTTLPLYFCDFWIQLRICPRLLECGLSVCLFVLQEKPPLCSWLFPNPMLGLSRTSSMPCPRQLLHPKFSSLVASEETCEPNCNVSIEADPLPAMRSS